MKTDEDQLLRKKKAKAVQRGSDGPLRREVPPRDKRKSLAPRPSQAPVRRYHVVPSCLLNRYAVEERYALQLPSFITGLAATLALAGRVSTSLYPEDEDPWMEDACALANDWRVVGADLVEAARRVRR